VPTADFSADLRKPFPPETIGKIPKAGRQLDYVGHAAVTDRLLTVDPSWTWEPMGYAADGRPAIHVRGDQATLWIKLTVCGVTRPGVGSVAASKADVEKELVGDALRNAAMRFGVALDLWSKEELESQQNESQPRTAPAPPRDGRTLSIPEAEAIIHAKPVTNPNGNPGWVKTLHAQSNDLANEYWSAEGLLKAAVNSVTEGRTASTRELNDQREANKVAKRMTELAKNGG